MAMTEPTAQAAPIDAIVERLNDPACAAAMVTLLDNAELLSTLVLGLSGLMERGDLIMDAVAESVGDIKAAAADQSSNGQRPSVAELGALAGQLSSAAPLLSDVLNSSIAKPETIAVLSELSEAAAEGRANAAQGNSKIGGIRDALRTLKDPEVQSGLGVFVEIARSLGRRVR